MTRRRYDDHSTEFGLWLRAQEEIDSKKGFVATNIDYMWSNYKNGPWMLLEEKRYVGEIRYSQRKLFDVIDRAARHDPQYRGLYIVKFEKTSPEDGKIYLNGRPITKEQLISFLKFEQ